MRGGAKFAAATLVAISSLSPDPTRMTLHEQTETMWALINLTARLGGRRLLVSNHKSAMRRGETGMKAATSPEAMRRRMWTQFRSRREKEKHGGSQSRQ
jgi:hypothetical protein